MPGTHDPATVERARLLVETTARTLEDIAAANGVPVPTLRSWIARHASPRADGAAP